MPCHGCDKLVERLRVLSSTTELSWREIALLPEFYPVPFSTLIKIKKTGHVPEKWRPRLLRRYKPLRQLEPNELLVALQNRLEYKPNEGAYDHVFYRTPLTG